MVFSLSPCPAYYSTPDEAVDRYGVRVRAYTEHLLSGEGKHEGIYWPTTDDAPDSPMGPLVAEATPSGYSLGEGDGPHLYHGYLYQHLEAQGATLSGKEEVGLGTEPLWSS